MYFIHYFGNPVIISFDESRFIVDCLCVWEHIIDIGDSMLNECVFQRTISTSFTHDLLKFGLRQNFSVVRITCHVIAVVKYIVFHVIISSFIFFIFIVGYSGIFQSLSDHSVNNIFLFIGHTVKYITDCFFFTGFSTFFWIILGMFYIFVIIVIIWIDSILFQDLTDHSVYSLLLFIG